MKIRNRAALTVAAIATTAALALTSCASTAGSAAADGTLKVVATTTQLADFAHQIGGDDISLTGLLKPGASAHQFDPTPADLKALAEADVLIVNGAGLEGFVDSAVEASGFDGAVITASEGIDLAEAEEITAEGTDGNSGHDHDADHDHVDDHTDEADHDHGSINPHLWTAPRFAEGMAAMIAGELARLDPEHSNDYLARADTYLAQLKALDGWVAAQFERIPEAERVLVSGHDSLRYYLHDYGIEFAGSLLPSFEDNAEPSITETDALIAAIQDRGVKAIFVESSLSPKLAETVAKATGVAVVASDTLHVDALGGEGSGAETYIDATVQNTRVIIEAWGGTTTPLPEELQ